ncbi:MAG: hypothetical protein AABX11_07200 [Nanoarchaeota archaeon]
MVNITLSIPDELKAELQKHDEINWSAIIRKALQEQIIRLNLLDSIAQKSKLSKKDVDEISNLIDSSIAKKLKGK